MAYKTTCPYCGSINDHDSGICLNCGQSIPVKTLPKDTLLNDGHYKIESVIGKGGFGITYKAEDLYLNVPVAIKEFFPDQIVVRDTNTSNDVSIADGGYEEYNEQFQKGKRGFLEEARKLALFKTEENIVHVENFFEENCTAYIVMELLDGVTVAQYIKMNGKMSFDKCLEFMIPIMMLLDKMYSHQRIIHRDVSPSNIMILKNGSVKLVDFGTARKATGETLTAYQTGGYSAPEQVYSNDQKAFTDVFSLCATMYFMVTGKDPDLYKRPSELGADITPEQESVLMRGLELNPKKRIQSMGDLYRQFYQARQEHKRADPPRVESDPQPEESHLDQTVLIPRDINTVRNDQDTRISRKIVENYIIIASFVVIDTLLLMGLVNFITNF